MNPIRTTHDDVSTTPIRVVLPGHLCTLAGIAGELPVDAPVPVTIGGILDAVESRFPVLCGAIRDHHAGPRRPYVRFFACGEDVSFESFDAGVPPSVIDGSEPFLIIGSISGG